MYNQLTRHCADPLLTIDGNDGIGRSKAKRQDTVAGGLYARLLDGRRCRQRTG